MRASIQLVKVAWEADASEAEISAAESSIQSAVIGLELRANSDKGTVSETSVAKKADADEQKKKLSKLLQLIVQLLIVLFCQLAQLPK